MKRLFKTYLEKPELAGLILLVLLVVVFQIRSNGVFLNQDNLRGMLGILPETGLVAIGVTILMISGEFDLSVGSVFALDADDHGGADGAGRAVPRRHARRPRSSARRSASSTAM